MTLMTLWCTGVYVCQGHGVCCRRSRWMVSLLTHRFKFEPEEFRI
jgi:hypothetical protein